MSRPASKACGNRDYKARVRAAKYNEKLLTRGGVIECLSGVTEDGSITDNEWPKRAEEHGKFNKLGGTNMVEANIGRDCRAGTTVKLLPHPRIMNRKLRIIPPIFVSIAAVLLLSIYMIRAVSVEATMKSNVTEFIQAQQEAIQNVEAKNPMRTEVQAIENMSEPTHINSTGSRDWGGEDAEVLLKVAMAEAEGESVEGKALVMLAILNRISDDRFPETIEEVVFQQSNGIYQFSSIKPGGRYYTTEPNEECYEALRLVEQGWDESQGALYFESCEGSSWHSENLNLLFQEGGHKFYK